MPRMLAWIALVVGVVSVQPSAADEFDSPTFLEALERQWSFESLDAPQESDAFLRSRDARIESLSLSAVVAMAIENNPELVAERLGPAAARTAVAHAYARFEPELSLSGSFSRDIRPTGSALSGAATLRETNRDFGVSLRKLLRTGTRLSIEFDSNEHEQNSTFLGLRPLYEPELRFSIAQPLLRGFGPGLTILLLRSAELKSEAAYYRYEAHLTRIVRDVISAYWQVVLAGEELAAEREGLRLARDLERENEIRVEAGVLPPIAVREAAADAASRDERVIVAENALATASDQLRLLVQRNPERAFLPRAIQPSEAPEVRPVETPEGPLLEAAIRHRPEIHELRTRITDAMVLVRFRRNELLPSLDLEASYGRNGLSGRAVPQTDFQTGETGTSRFGGSYARALDRLASGNFESYSGGISLTLPIGNAAAEAEYTKSRIILQQEELRYRQLLADVTLEVRTAIGNVRSSSKRITASRLARELAEETLEQQHERLEAGLATTRDALDSQEKLTAARASEIRALIEYNLALAELGAASGSLLERFGIVLETLPPPVRPVWASF